MPSVVVFFVLYLLLLVTTVEYRSVVSLCLTIEISHAYEMPRGRPKRIVPPCRHCDKQFKRQEHLARHERTRKMESDFSRG